MRSKDKPAGGSAGAPRKPGAGAARDTAPLSRAVSGAGVVELAAAGIVQAADAWESAAMAGYGSRIDVAGRALTNAVQAWRAAQGRTDLRSIR